MLEKVTNKASTVQTYEMNLNFGIISTLNMLMRAIP